MCWAHEWPSTPPGSHPAIVSTLYALNWYLVGTSDQNVNLSCRSEKSFHFVVHFWRLPFLQQSAITQSFTFSKHWKSYQMSWCRFWQRDQSCSHLVQSSTAWTKSSLICLASMEEWRNLGCSNWFEHQLIRHHDFGKTPGNPSLFDNGFQQV